MKVIIKRTLEERPSGITLAPTPISAWTKKAPSIQNGWNKEQN